MESDNNKMTDTLEGMHKPCIKSDNIPMSKRLHQVRVHGCWGMIC